MKNEHVILCQQFQALEAQLLHSDFKDNPQLIDTLLAQDFEEIGSSGHITNRAQVVDWLMKKERDQRWRFANFRVRQLSPELVLVNYIAEKLALPVTDNIAIAEEEKHKMLKSEQASGSIRSSLWQHQHGCWKMVFHQASKISQS